MSFERDPPKISLLGVIIYSGLIQGNKRLFKKSVTREMTFFDSPSLNVTLCHFFSTFPPLSHSLKGDLLWHKKGGDFFSIYGCLTISHIKGGKKVRNCRFNLCDNSLLHIDLHVLTSHVGKMVEFQCFESINIATPDTQIALWMRYLCCSL